eukprot:1157118-Pelagomonas_calceolata.AAC.7
MDTPIQSLESAQAALRADLEAVYGALQQLQAQQPSEGQDVASQLAGIQQQVQVWDVAWTAATGKGCGLNSSCGITSVSMSQMQVGVAASQLQAHIVAPQLAGKGCKSHYGITAAGTVVPSELQVHNAVSHLAELQGSQFRYQLQMKKGCCPFSNLPQYLAFH